MTVDTANQSVELLCRLYAAKWRELYAPSASVQSSKYSVHAARHVREGDRPRPLAGQATSA